MALTGRGPSSTIEAEMCIFCGSPDPVHLEWVPFAIGAFGYYKGKQAIRRAEQERRAKAQRGDPKPPTTTCDHIDESACPVQPTERG